ncbi:hypothetical protein [Streptomyces sp. MP131-18]|uniref:hypothetical protein n=1 Tax=Streptomyces sp. MP131-18 TaxID=1857892 RepID=UPI00097C8C02|nr:hypothetical protein [Streptomyces sp. MP131-18]
MTEAGTIPVTARVAHGTKEQLQELKPVFADERRRAREMRGEERWSTEGLRGREAAGRRAEWLEHRARLRDRGELVDTLDVLVALGVRAELASRGWDVDWPPLPAEALLPGRWPGSRDGGWPEKVPLRLPAGLVTTVWSACWHTSAEPIAQLRDWRDRHPDALPTRAFRSRGEDQALDEYQRLAAQVTTAGEIWRAGIKRGLMDVVPTVK